MKPVSVASRSLRRRQPTGSAGYRRSRRADPEPIGQRWLKTCAAFTSTWQRGHKTTRRAGRPGWRPALSVTENSAFWHRGDGADKSPKMNARTRALSPVLPQLVSSVAAQLRRAELRLAAATSADADSTFSVADEQWRKGPRPDRRRRSFPEHDVTAIDQFGRRVDLSKAEDRAFWTWAIVEVLRHTGVRIEELLELTPLSLRPFRKPDGQIIPLLQIAPSKSAVERVLPVGPELAHVLARIVLRISETSPDTGSGATNPPTVPLVSRWDWHERVHTPAMPFLFQRSFLIGRRGVIRPGTVANLLAAAGA